MVEFTRLAGALDGNEALQRRARLAALSLTVLSGERGDCREGGRAHRRRRPAPQPAPPSASPPRRRAGRSSPSPCPPSASRAWSACSAWAISGSRATWWPMAAISCSSSSSSPPCARRSAPRDVRAAVGDAGHRAGGRALPAPGFQRPAAPHLFRGGGRGHSAHLPAHRRRRRAAIPRAPERSPRSPGAFASSPSTCRGTASPRRRRASSARPTGSPPISMSTP